jgi:hypothetical protein
MSSSCLPFFLPNEFRPIFVPFGAGFIILLPWPVAGAEDGFQAKLSRGAGLPAGTPEGRAALGAAA